MHSGGCEDEYSTLLELAQAAAGEDKEDVNEEDKEASLELDQQEIQDIMTCFDGATNNCNHVFY